MLKSLPRWRTLTEADKLAEVKAAIADNGNYTTMSAQFGVSRGAIAKFCMNNGLKTADALRRQKGSTSFVTPKMRAARAAARGKQLKPAYFTSPKRFNDRGNRPPPVAAVRPPRQVDGLPIRIPDMLEISFLERKDNQCAYPLWGKEHNPPVSELLVCGLPQRDDSPYCPEHHSGCYYKPTLRRDED